MNTRLSLALAALLSSTTLAACGGAGAALPNGGSGGGSTQSLATQTQDSIASANAFADPVRNLSAFNELSGSPPSASFTRDGVIRQTASGACNNGVEFFSPDRSGDASSTELITFYDNACTQPARDAVRVVTSTGSNSENVARTVSLYALNATAPQAVRSDSVSLTNAQFDRFYFPIAAGGFDATYAGNLNISGAKTIDADGEVIVAPSSSSSTTFCSDSAGFNATGYAALGETAGWAGTNANGTRTVNSDGSVTWQLTRTGTVYTAAIGALSIQAGAQNTSCPISTPMFGLTGGTASGNYNIPITATYAHGVLTNLTIANAALVDGDILNVSTNSSLSPGDPHFISGALTNGSNTVATFNVDAFGDGTLLVTASGKAFPMEDWHVIR